MRATASICARKPPCFVEDVELTPLEQLSLVIDTLTGSPIPHVNVRAYGCDWYLRYDDGGMPVEANTHGDWTIGLPNDVRAALRALVAAKHAKRVDHEARAIVSVWIAKHRQGPLADEARSLRAKYLKANPLGQFRRIV